MTRGLEKTRRRKARRSARRGTGRSADKSNRPLVRHGGEEYLYNPKKRWQDEPADGRRTMKLEWAYKLYMKASDAGVPFFFKQITSARSGVGADRLIGKEIHEFPAPPNGGVWWEPPSELVVLR